MKNAHQVQIRSAIAAKIRDLRRNRHWTQAELSKRLGLSQGRYSEIERGQGSFTAEQFLEILNLFDVPVAHFAERQNGDAATAENAVAPSQESQKVCSGDSSGAMDASRAIARKPAQQPESNPRKAIVKTKVGEDLKPGFSESSGHVLIRHPEPRGLKALEMDWD